MKILLIGHGGREHALLRKLGEDAPGAQFFITRGNGGTVPAAHAIPLDPQDTAALAAWAEQNAIDLAIVGPEAPLAAGIVDRLADRGVPAFGPTRAAARIEASKTYAKTLMRRAGVPTAAFATFTDFERARTFIAQQGTPIVVKASGLAAGKGAVVCTSVAEALDTARAMLAGESFGAAGAEIVVEAFLQGEELSVFALTDGEHALLMLPAQDHKRLEAGDRGPNTGGMGAYTPVSLATPPLLERVRRDIILPTLAALREDGHPFRGLLFAGIMLNDAGPKVVEFNARFGDPEAQVVLPLLASSLLEPMLASARGESVAGMQFGWKPAAAMTTVLAARGYPGEYETGHVIHIPDAVTHAADIIVYHAGTKQVGDRIVTNGGRVLAVTAIAPTLAGAAERSRWAAAAITFAGKQYRADIGWRELARLPSS